MPWEKSFDLDYAVDRAQEIFWAKGYEATSVTDLTEGMGINKGSLYNAFGSKNELFARTLLKYDLDNRKAMLARLRSLDDPQAAVSKLFDGLIAESLADAERKGCFLVNTALELPNHTSDIQEMVSKALREFEGFFKSQILLGQRRSVIPKSVKAKQTAKTLLSLVVGLRVLARGACDARALRAIKKDAMRLIS